MRRKNSSRNDLSLGSNAERPMSDARWALDWPAHGRGQGPNHRVAHEARAILAGDHPSAAAGPRDNQVYSRTGAQIGGIMTESRLNMSVAQPTSLRVRNNAFAPMRR
jgi:hypothetical protein